MEKRKPGRPSGPKVRNNGRWTQARYNSFITSALRSASRKWGPFSDVLREAKTRRGMYKCAGCQNVVPVTIKKGRKRTKNVHVDHIEPVVPVTGFTTWDDYINRMFCEADGLQVLCSECHKSKTQEEQKQRKEHNETNNL